jgi:1-pyrroline-5-carboxylate dehydrogenase
MKIGDPTDFSVFTSAVIDEKAYDRIVGYVQHAKSNLKILQGGTSSKKEGWFVNPTLVETKDPNDRIMKEEIFGPVLTAYAYPDAEVDSILKFIDESTPYALTGGIFAEDEAFLKKATETLKYSSGNYYINDRSTGAVVGQQPFGGGRHSGTNDKAGAPGYILKFTSPQTVKQTFVPLKDWKYPYMG